MPEFRFFVTQEDEVALQWVMSKEGWDLNRVVRASLEAFLLLRDYAGFYPGAYFPFWLPLDHESRGRVLYWEPSMMNQERRTVFHDLVISGAHPWEVVWGELCSLSAIRLSGMAALGSFAGVWIRFS